VAIDWDDPLPPIEELHVEAAAISRRVALREALVGVEYDLWWLRQQIAAGVAKG
jgi:hypothetical protein